MQNIFENQFRLFFVFLTGAFLTLLLTYPISKLAKKFGLIDKPSILRSESDTTKNRRIHTKLTVRSGGIAIVITFAFLYLIFFNTSLNLGLLAGLLILTLLGITDDRYEISGKWQLVIQLIAVSITVLSGIQISNIDKGIPGMIQLSPILAIIISIFWIMILINAINWVDGIDGLSSGIVTIAAGTMAILNLQQGNLEVALLAIILAGSTAGYIPWNFPPNKGTFVGGTATIFGFLLGVISILGSTKSASSVLVLLIPIIDMIWVLVGRIHKHEIANPLSYFKFRIKLIYIIDFLILD